MAFNIKGEKINAKRKGELTEVDNKNPHHKAALKYNHIRVQFPDGKEKSLLFTDNQIRKALDRADHNLEDLPENGWLRSFAGSVVETDIADLQEVENTKKLPAAADKYNHIVVHGDNLPGTFTKDRTHLLFTDNEIKTALKRAEKNPEDLPKISWFTDILD